MLDDRPENELINVANKLITLRRHFRLKGLEILLHFEAFLSWLAIFTERHAFFLNYALLLELVEELGCLCKLNHAG